MQYGPSPGLGRQGIRGMEDLPADRGIIVYCRGPYCIQAAGAVRQLREAGFSAVRLLESIPDWQAMGQSVAEGEAAPQS